MKLLLEIIIYILTLAFALLFIVPDGTHYLQVLLCGLLLLCSLLFSITVGKKSCIKKIAVSALAAIWLMVILNIELLVVLYSFALINYALSNIESIQVRRPFSD